MAELSKEALALMRHYADLRASFRYIHDYTAFFKRRGDDGDLRPEQWELINAGLIEFGDAEQSGQLTELGKAFCAIVGGYP